MKAECPRCGVIGVPSRFPTPDSPYWCLGCRTAYGDPKPELTPAQLKERLAKAEGVLNAAYEAYMKHAMTELGAIIEAWGLTK